MDLTTLHTLKGKVCQFREKSLGTFESTPHSMLCFFDPGCMSNIGVCVCELELKGQS